VPKTVSLPTNHPHFDLVEVTFGLIDDAARIAFGWGWCHSLMLAIEEATGWGDFWGAYYEDDSDTEPLHVAMRRPDGLLVDIDGVHHLHEYVSMTESNGTEYPIEWYKIYAEDVGNFECYFEPEQAMDAARSLVVPVLGHDLQLSAAA
jgi:hypothetical protein